MYTFGKKFEKITPHNKSGENIVEVGLPENKKGRGKKKREKKRIQSIPFSSLCSPPTHAKSDERQEERVRKEWGGGGKNIDGTSDGPVYGLRVKGSAGQIEGPIFAEQKGNKLTLRTSVEGEGEG